MLQCAHEDQDWPPDAEEHRGAPRDWLSTSVRRTDLVLPYPDSTIPGFGSTVSPITGSGSTVSPITGADHTVFRRVLISGHCSDIKPANYAVGLPPKDSTIYLLDFGIARPYREKDGTVRYCIVPLITYRNLPYHVLP